MAKVHVAVDDATRLACIEVLDDERKGTTTGCLLRSLRGLGIRHTFTRPCTPGTDGKA